MPDGLVVAAERGDVERLYVIDQPVLQVIADSWQRILARIHLFDDSVQVDQQELVIRPVARAQFFAQRVLFFGKMEL